MSERSETSHAPGTDGVATTITTGSPGGLTGPQYLTPHQLASRWSWHVESVRRAIRQGRIESVIIFRRRLVPLLAIERIEAGGRTARAIDPEDGV